MRRILRSKAGVTLVELLISIAIFSVVTFALFTFMGVVSRQYTKNNNEVVVQNEVQTLMAHLQDIVVGANTNIGVEDKRLFMIYDDTFYVIEYDTSSEYLYYYDMTQLGADAADVTAYVSENDRDQKFTKAKKMVTDNAITDSDTLLANYLLSEYVSTFNIDATHLSDNYMTVTLELKKESVSFKAAKNIFLRNKLYDITEYGLASTNTSSSLSSLGESSPSGSSEGGSPGDSSNTETVTLEGISASWVGGVVRCDDIITKSNISVIASYSDGSSATVSDWTTSSSMYGKDHSSSNCTITVSYGGYTQDVIFTYAELDKITYSVNFSNKYAGATLSKSDFIVTNHYTNGASSKVTTDYTVSPAFSALVEGSNDYTFTSTIDTSKSISLSSHLRQFYVRAFWWKFVYKVVWCLLYCD